MGKFFNNFELNNEILTRAGLGPKTFGLPSVLYQLSFFSTSYICKISPFIDNAQY